MTYAELQTLIADYMHRPDLTTQIPTFIEQARSRINRDLRAREMVQRIVFTPTTNPIDLLTVVPDFIEARDLSYKQSRWQVSLKLVSRSELSKWVQGSSQGESTPRFYSVDGQSIQTAPGGVGVEFTLIYYAKTPALVSPTDTNEILTTYPTIYLYASLIEANSFVQDMEQRSASTEVYASEVARANEASAMSEAGSAIVMQGASQWL